MKYDAYVIGNAIVDIVTEVEFDFFTKNQVEKGVMTLVDEQRQLQLMQAIDMKKSKMSGGGSGGNTATALAQFGARAFSQALSPKILLATSSSKRSLKMVSTQTSFTTTVPKDIPAVASL